MHYDEAVSVVGQFPQNAPSLIAQLKPSLRVHAKRVDSHNLRVGESRIGGHPDLPAGFEWPTWHARRNEFSKQGRKLVDKGTRHLDFVAQLRLSDLPLERFEGMPRTGMLHFFYDIEEQPWGYDPCDRGAWKVIYLPGDSHDLVATAPPREVHNLRLYPCRVAATPEWTLPDPVYLNHSDTDWDLEEYEALRTKLAGGSAWGDVKHRMFGHPDVVQNPMELECQLASSGVYVGDLEGYESERAKALKHGADDWRLLLQIDSDEDNPGWMWGDSGRIYYWIRQSQLRKLDFSDVWLVLQCF